MRAVAVFAVLVAALAVIHIAQAQTEVCGEALRPDTFIRAANNYEKTSFFLSLDENTFNELKLNNSSSAGFEVYGIPFSFGDAWSAVQTKQESLKKVVRYDNLHSYQSETAVSFVKAANLDAFTDRLKEKSVGLSVITKKNTKTSTIVRIVFGTHKDDPTQRYVEIAADNAAIVGGKSRYPFKGPTALDIILHRQTPDDIDLVVTQGTLGTEEVTPVSQLLLSHQRF